jgi:hypothetical protein
VLINKDTALLEAELWHVGSVQDAGIIGVFINDRLTVVSLEKAVAGFADAWAVNTFQLLCLLFVVLFMPTLLRSTRSR